MSKVKSAEYKPGYVKSAISGFGTYIGFPFSVSRQIARHSSGCRQLIAEVKDALPNKTDQKRNRIIQYLTNVIEANNRLTLFAINGPMIMSILASAMYFTYKYNNSYKFIPQASYQLYQSIRSITFKEIFDANFRRQQVRLFELTSVLDFKPLLFMFAGHTVGVLGAVVLTRHKAFKMDQLIKQELRRFNYLDSNDQPWRVVWTPEVMLFETYHADANSLKMNARFWDQVRFNPDDPVPTIKDQNTYIIFKAGALPNKIDFLNWDHPTRQVKSALSDDAVSKALQNQLEEKQRAAMEQLNQEEENSQPSTNDVEESVEDNSDREET